MILVYDTIFVIYNSTDKCHTSDAWRVLLDLPKICYESYVGCDVGLFDENAPAPP